ncbi:pilus assembly protein PilM [Effusibacillus lacus]|uniref:Pilus assembly protein PilM n=1 Tax=Effusibacillus lacus TaxID=1348429 RepID=A0A292YJ26_9BACL|nr:pilus assembly protein PilM [Effusibacillus lacus]TCS74624.1 type IV pilus assembly protein PilM [Effusibacillus lacus]GAX88495.1 hypothetical protein EFBL_0104 [Effusibacillus lacus]
MQFSFKRHTGVGISLKADRLEVVYARGGHGVVEVLAHEVIPFSNQIYDNGRIHDFDRFASDLNNTFRKYRLPIRKVVLNLPSAAAVIRMVAMPKVGRKQMQDLLRFQLHDQIWLPMNDPVYDFDFFPPELQPKEQVDEQGDQAMILLVAAPGELINGLVRAFKEAGIRLAAIEVKGLSALRALKALNKKPDQAALLVDFGTEGVTAHFYQKGSLLMTRTLDMRADDYILPQGQGAWGEVAVTAAGESALQASFGGNTDSKWDVFDQENEALLDSLCRDLSYQIQRSISFLQYSLKQRDFALGTVYLNNHVPSPTKMANSLAAQLGISTEILQIPIIRQSVRTPHKVVSLPAAGAALRGVISDAD